MLAWLRKILRRWRGDEPDAEPPVSRTTVEVVPAASLTHDLTHARLSTTAQDLQTAAFDDAARRKALLAERIEVPLRRWRKRSKGAVYQARYRARLKAEDPEGYLLRKREDEAERRARKKAEKAAAQAAQVGVGADVINLTARRAQRAAEAPDAVEQVEQQAQRALPD
jgi:hypothetical protein